jgi:seryl-tRNA synthetase
MMEWVLGAACVLALYTSYRAFQREVEWDRRIEELLVSHKELQALEDELSDEFRKARDITKRLQAELFAARQISSQQKELLN